MTQSFVPCIQCPDQCSEIFDRVVLSYLISGMTIVRWDLLPTFTDHGDLTFQLQVGTTTDQNADDWTDVGSPIVNTYFAIDPEQRVFGKTNWTYYRVLLTSSVAQYVSMPTGAVGTLSKRDWLKVKNLARRKRTTMRMGEGQEGFLLKRRVAGLHVKPVSIS